MMYYVAIDLGISIVSLLYHAPSLNDNASHPSMQNNIAYWFFSSCWKVKVLVWLACACHHGFALHCLNLFLPMFVQQHCTNGMCTSVCFMTQSNMVTSPPFFLHGIHPSPSCALSQDYMSSWGRSHYLQNICMLAWSSHLWQLKETFLKEDRIIWKQ